MPQLDRKIDSLLSTFRESGSRPDDCEVVKIGVSEVRRTDKADKRKSKRVPAGTSFPTPPRSGSIGGSEISKQEQIDQTDDAVNADLPSDADPVSDAEQLDKTKLKEADKENVPNAWGGKSAKSIEYMPSSGSFQPPASLLNSHGQKRIMDDEELGSDPEFWGSALQTSKRPRNGKRQVNIHAKVKLKTYGRDKGKTSSGFKKPAVQPPSKSTVLKTGFRAPGGLGNAEEDGTSYKPPKDNGPSFKMPGSSFGTDMGDLDPEASEIADLSGDEGTPEHAGLASLDQTNEESYVLTTECTYCGEQVDRLLKEEYEDRYNHGREVAFRWERRFCEYHRRKRAEEIWQERNYPVIDWSGLEKRMRKHDAFLLDILKDKKPSHYREVLKEKLKPRKRNFQQAIRDENPGRPSASVGYYGPRGEKVMVDHIVTSMSGELRQRATKDKLVASSGVRGGVSGFVQSVLAPHLAELLVMEDMNIRGKDGMERARSIIAESTEVGDLMNPEAEDKIAQDEEDEGEGDDEEDDGEDGEDECE